MYDLKNNYDKKNYSELGNDIDNLVQNIPKNDHLQKKISKKKVREKDFLKYISYIQKAKINYVGTTNRNQIQKDNTEYHPYYFIEKNKDEMIIVFRQSVEYKDYILDFKHYKQLLNNILYTHIKIISKMLFYYGLIHEIQKYKGKKITIVGNSLGAVLGVYLLLILNLLDKKKYRIENIDMKMYSFSCPICLPVFFLNIVNKQVIAVVNERDPIVCFRGNNQTILYTPGGKNIYNFVKDKKTNRVNCFQRNDNFFVNNKSLFWLPITLKHHRLDALENNIKLFLDS
tara:strand:+ start:270 stop:1127 length:858 start_codon:yes stop_codon:yes gene_type:complete